MREDRAPRDRRILTRCEGAGCIPKISVIVPLFNKAAYVRRCIDSILAQTSSDMEIIVVDDGSTDGGAEIVAAYRDPRIRLYQQPNSGPGAARNRGLEAASGEYVAFLDADDEWMRSYLERGAALLDAQPEVAAVASGYLEGPLGRSCRALWRKRGISDGALRLTPASSASFAVHVLACMSPCTTIARRCVVERWGGFNRNPGCVYGEDNELWLKVLLNEAVSVYAAPLAWWHSEASELSRNVRGPRPIEVFLQEPQGLFDACPPELRELLHGILAIRACKTACMLGFWGRWREGRQLAAHLSELKDYRERWVILGNLCATPFGSACGAMFRRAAGFVPGVKRWGSAQWGENG